LIVLPGRNFARFMLTMFILFCLIFRTAYQGVQLRLLEKTLNGKKKFTQLKEIVVSDHAGFKFFNEALMFKPIDRIVGQLVESGIAKRIVEQEATQTNQESSDAPVALSMHHLKIWFPVAIFMLVVALVAFIGELFVTCLTCK
jgi:hypothetical protein